MAAVLCYGLKKVCGKSCRWSLCRCGTSCSAQNSRTITNKACATKIPACGVMEEEDDVVLVNDVCHFCCPCLYMDWGEYVAALRNICTNPFGVLVTVAVVSNIPPMVIALTELGHLQFASGGVPVCPASWWLLINFLFCWVHIIASFYVVISINYHLHKKHHSHSHHSSSSHHFSAIHKTIYRRASNLFWYDPVMAVYILIALIYVGFTFVPRMLGLDLDSQSQSQSQSSSNSNNHYQRNNNYANANDVTQCTTYIHEKVIASVGFAWAFLVFGVGALALSFGFAYVDANPSSCSGSGGSQILADLDSTGTYTTMEEGGNQNNGKKRGDGGLMVLNDYIPPMIVYDPTDDTKGIELMSDTDDPNYATAGPTDIEDNNTLNNMTSIISGNNGVGFVTDLETDAEEMRSIENKTKKKATTTTQRFTAHRSPNHPFSRRRRRGRSTGLSPESSEDEKYEDEDITDHEPITSYEGDYYTTDGGGMSPTTGGGSVTDRIEEEEEEAGDSTTDFALSLGGASRTNLDRAIIDLDDSETDADNAFNVVNDPTVSIEYMTDAGGRTTEGEDGHTTDGGETTDDGGGSIGLRSVRNPHSTKTQRQKQLSNPAVTSKKNQKQSMSAPSSSSTKTKKSTKQQPLQLLLDTTHLEPDDDALVIDVAENPITNLNFDTRTANAVLSSSAAAAASASVAMDPLASLTYSMDTSIGTAIGNNEPLSFVDGGSCSNQFTSSTRNMTSPVDPPSENSNDD
jgi:hypothetical protein